MARDHARILCRIWEDNDFINLPEPAQRLYIMLLSQRTIDHAGMMPLQVSKWIKRCTTTTEKGMKAALGALMDGAYIVVDEYTEELLVRSFMRNDGIAKQPNMVRSALRAAEAVESAALRMTLADEIERLDDELGRLRGDVQAAARVTVQALKAAGAGSNGPPDGGSPNPSRTPREPLANPSVSPNGVQESGQNASPVKANRGVRVSPREGPGVGVGVGVGVGFNSTSNKKSKSKHLPDAVASGVSPQADDLDDATPPLLELVPPSSPQPQTSQQKTATFERFWITYPRRAAKIKARTAWDKALRQVDPEVLIEAAARYGRTADPKYFKHPTTWLNGGCWDDEPEPRHLSALPNGYHPYTDPVDQSVYEGRI